MDRLEETGNARCEAGLAGDDTRSMRSLLLVQQG